MEKTQLTGGDGWNAREQSYAAMAEIAILDRNVVFKKTTFQSGVRDWVMHLRTTDGVKVANPIELLGTNIACRLLKKICVDAPDQAHQVCLSRLLVQCLEYRGVARHLIIEPWTEQDLKGETFFEGNRTELARDCKFKQAESFRLVMSGGQKSDLPAEELYWGTFSTLPKVEDSFKDADLTKLAVELYSKIVEEGEGDAVVKLNSLRRLITSHWKNYFADFQLDVPVRQRRKLFKRLMSVAVRQSSSFMRQVAYALLLKSMSPQARNTFNFSFREETLFSIRYGSYPFLGNINVGFLHEYDEHHAELLNALGGALVGNESDRAIEEAEDNLFRNVQLLDEFRETRKAIRKDQRFTTRDNRQKSPPKETKWKNNEPPDTREKAPDSELITLELIDQAKLILDDLKPRCRGRVLAMIEADADWDEAAKTQGVETFRFRKRFLETTQPNIKKALRRKNQRGN